MTRHIGRHRRRTDSSRLSVRLLAGLAASATAFGLAAASPPGGGPASAASRGAPTAERPATTTRTAARPAVARPAAARPATRAKSAPRAARVAANTPQARATRAARLARQTNASATTTRVAAAVAPATAAPALRTFAWHPPVAGTHRSSGFGQRWGRLHAGVDFAGPVGTPIRSVCGGTVTFVGAQGGYGNKVEVTCWDGTVVYFGHLHRAATKVGASVEPAQAIATLGNTGRSTGPHLHLEVRPGGGAPVDPEPWLDARGITPVPAPAAAPAGRPGTDG